MPLTDQQRTYIKTHFSGAKLYKKPTAAIKSYKKYTNTVEAQLKGLSDARKPAVFIQAVESLYTDIKETANQGDFALGAEMAKQLIPLTEAHQNGNLKPYTTLDRSIRELFSQARDLATHIESLSGWLHQQLPQAQAASQWDGNARRNEFDALQAPQQVQALTQWYDDFYQCQRLIESCPRPEKRITRVLQEAATQYDDLSQQVYALPTSDVLLAQLRTNLMQALNGFVTSPVLQSIRTNPADFTPIDPQPMLDQHANVMAGFKLTQAGRLQDLESMWSTLERPGDAPMLELIKDMSADLFHQTHNEEVQRLQAGTESGVHWNPVLTKPLSTLASGQKAAGLQQLKSRWKSVLGFSKALRNDAVFEILSLTEPQLLEFVSDRIQQVDPTFLDNPAITDVLPELAELLRTVALEKAPSTFDPAQQLLMLEGKPYSVDRKLAEGAAGEVYRYVDAQGNPVIVKIAKAANPDVAKGDMAKELRVHRRLMKADPNEEGLNYIVKLHDTAYDANGNLYVVMEEVKGGNLEKQHHTLSFMVDAGIVPHELQQILQSNQVKQLTKALLLLKKQNVIHFDIKPENILLTNEGTPKLADFGSGSISSSATGESPEQGHGSRGFYMNNRAEMGHQYDDRDDAFSLGRLMQMLTLGSPHAEYGSLEKGGTVLNQLISRITQQTRGTGTTIEAVLESSYFKVGDYVEEAKLAELSEQIKAYSKALDVRARELGLKLLQFDNTLAFSLGQNAEQADGQTVIYNARLLKTELEIKLKEQHEKLRNAIAQNDTDTATTIQGQLQKSLQDLEFIQQIMNDLRDTEMAREAAKGIRTLAQETMGQHPKLDPTAGVDLDTLEAEWKSYFEPLRKLPMGPTLGRSFIAELQTPECEVLFERFNWDIKLLINRLVVCSMSPTTPPDKRRMLLNDFKRNLQSIAVKAGREQPNLGILRRILDGLYGKLEATEQFGDLLPEAPHSDTGKHFLEQLDSPAVVQLFQQNAWNLEILKPKLKVCSITQEMPSKERRALLNTFLAEIPGLVQEVAALPQETNGTTGNPMLAQTRIANARILTGLLESLHTQLELLHKNWKRVSL